MMQSDHRPVSASYVVATNMPYVNLCASKSVVNREKCDILFSDLCVELQDSETLARDIAAAEEAENVEQENPLAVDQTVEEESFDFGGGGGGGGGASSSLSSGSHDGGTGGPGGP